MAADGEERSSSPLRLARRSPTPECGASTITRPDRPLRPLLVIAGALALAAAGSWGAWLASASWRGDDSHDHGHPNIIVGDRPAVRACIETPDGGTAASNLLAESLERVRLTTPAWEESFPGLATAVQAGCPGGYRRAELEEHSAMVKDAAIVDTPSPLSLHVFVDDSLDREFLLAGFELQCSGDLCRAVSWAPFVPGSTPNDPPALDDAVRSALALPGPHDGREQQEEKRGRREHPREN